MGMSPQEEINVFTALAKYNSASDENYLTESFEFVINSILQCEHPIGVQILNQLCVNDSDFCFDIGEDISVSTQKTTEDRQTSLEKYHFFLSPTQTKHIEALLKVLPFVLGLKFFFLSAL